MKRTSGPPKTVPHFKPARPPEPEPQTTLRVEHPLGWKFNADGPQESVEGLFTQWLEFLHPRLLVTHEPPTRIDSSTKEERPLPATGLWKSGDNGSAALQKTASAHFAPKRSKNEAIYDWEKARVMYERGDTLKSIQRELGCHYTTLYVRAKKWKRAVDTPAPPSPFVPRVPRVDTPATPTAPTQAPRDAAGNTRFCAQCGVTVPAKRKCPVCHSPPAGTVSEER